MPKFGEHVYFEPAKTVKIPKEEGRWRSGIWMGFVDSSNENIIGTSKGVLKCRSIRRHDRTEQFDAVMIESIKGTPRQPVLGEESLQIPTNIEESGEIINENSEIEGYAEENQNVEERFNPGIDPEEDESFQKAQNEEKEEKAEKEREKS